MRALILRVHPDLTVDIEAIIEARNRMSLMAHVRHTLNQLTSSGPHSIIRIMVEDGMGSFSEKS